METGRNPLRWRNVCVIAAALCALLPACSEEIEFERGRVFNPNDLDAVGNDGGPFEPVPVEDEAFTKQLGWNLTCPGADPGTPSQTPADIIGHGDHPVVIGKDDILRLNLSGDFCPIVAPKRDVVLIVDTSGSMTGLFGSDPERNGSCARLSATRSLISSFSLQNDVQVSVITFADIAAIAGFGLKPAAEVATAGYINKQNLCAGDGGTNYNAALDTAIQVFTSQGRNDALREVYFISDGEPNNGSDGLQSAETLKNKQYGHGATIATLMLKGNDRALKRLASVGPDGTPLHRKTNNVGQLSKILSELATPRIIGGELMLARTQGTVDMQLSALQPVTQAGLRFPHVDLPISDWRDGVYVSVTMTDNFNQTNTYEGSLRWELKTP